MKMKRLLYLWLLFPCLCLAGITCTQNGDGSWTCSGDGISGPGITVDPSGDTVCTNCVNMTPEQCADLKATLHEKIDDILATGLVLSGDLQYVRDQLYEFKNKWSEFPDCPLYPLNSGGSQPASQLTVYQYLLTLGPLYIDYESIALTLPTSQPDDASSRNAWMREYNEVNFNGVGGGTSPYLMSAYSTYAYYHGIYLYIQSVLPDIQSFIDNFTSSKTLLDEDVLRNTSILKHYVEMVNCSNCVLSASSGSGSGSTGGGTSQGDFCPECLKVILQEISAKITIIKNQLDAQKIVLDNQLNVQQLSKNLLEELVEAFKRFAVKFDTYSNNMTNLVGRIDDYLETDQKINLDHIKAAIIVLSNDVDTVQKKFFTRAIKATNLETQDNTEPLYLAAENDPYSVATNLFVDFPANQSMYRQYDWFSRVEMLLMQIAAPSKGKEESTLSSTAESQLTSKVEQLQDALDASSVNSSFNTLATQVKTTYQRVSNIIPPGQPVATVVLLDSGSWIGESELTLSIPQNIQTTCHIIMVTIWTALALTVFTYYAMFFIPVIWKIFLDITNVIGAIAGQNCT